MIEELQLVFMIRDKDTGKKLDMAHTPKYIRAMIKLLQWCKWGSVNLIYDIVEAEQ